MCYWELSRAVWRCYARHQMKYFAFSLNGDCVCHIMAIKKVKILSQV